VMVIAGADLGADTLVSPKGARQSQMKIVEVKVSAD
jgi:hypothetical protein